MPFRLLSHKEGQSWAGLGRAAHHPVQRLHQAISQIWGQWWPGGAQAGTWPCLDPASTLAQPSAFSPSPDGLFVLIPGLARDQHSRLAQPPSPILSIRGSPLTEASSLETIRQRVLGKAETWTLLEIFFLHIILKYQKYPYFYSKIFIVNIPLTDWIPIVLRRQHRNCEEKVREKQRERDKVVSRLPLNEVWIFRGGNVALANCSNILSSPGRIQERISVWIRLSR